MILVWSDYPSTPKDSIAIMVSTFSALFNIVTWLIWPLSMLVNPFSLSSKLPNLKLSLDAPYHNDNF